jgi:hypothetical protein
MSVPKHIISAGAVVINEEGEILLIRLINLFAF